IPAVSRRATAGAFQQGIGEVRRDGAHNTIECPGIGSTRASAAGLGNVISQFRREIAEAGVVTCQERVKEVLSWFRGHWSLLFLYRCRERRVSINDLSNVLAGPRLQHTNRGIKLCVECRKPLAKYGK